jgi:hypothetical protein
VYRANKTALLSARVNAARRLLRRLECRQERRRFVFGSGKLLSSEVGKQRCGGRGKHGESKNTTRCRAAQKRYEATVVWEGGTVKRPACAPVWRRVSGTKYRAVSRGHANGCGTAAAVMIRPIGTSEQRGSMGRLPAICYAIVQRTSAAPKLPPASAVQGSRVSLPGLPPSNVAGAERGAGVAGDLRRSRKLSIAYGFMGFKWAKVTSRAVSCFNQ